MKVRLMKIYLFIELKAKPERVKTLESTLKKLRTDLPLVSGCHAAQPLVQRDMDQAFFVLEEWDSVEAHQAHMDQLKQSGAWDELLEMLEEPPRARHLCGL